MSREYVVFYDLNGRDGLQWTCEAQSSDDAQDQFETMIFRATKGRKAHIITIEAV